MIVRFKKESLSKAKLLEEAAKLKEVLEKHDCPVVFCHNDMLCKNIVFNKETGN
jgi:ethanolamine kinase